MNMKKIIAAILVMAFSTTVSGQEMMDRMT